MIEVYGMFINWLFTFKLSGVPVGFILMACIVFLVIVSYILGSIRN